MLSNNAVQNHYFERNWGEVKASHSEQKLGP